MRGGTINAWTNVTSVNEPCPKNWFNIATAHFWVRGVSFNECHVYKWVMRMSRGTCMNESCHTNTEILRTSVQHSHGTFLSSWHLPFNACHVYTWVMNFTFMTGSCHMYVESIPTQSNIPQFVAHVSMSHGTCMNESCHMYIQSIPTQSKILQFVAHVGMSQCTCIHESCHMYIESIQKSIWLMLLLLIHKKSSSSFAGSSICLVSISLVTHVTWLIHTCAPQKILIPSRQSSRMTHVTWLIHTCAPHTCGKRMNESCHMSLHENLFNISTAHSSVRGICQSHTHTQHTHTHTHTHTLKLTNSEPIRKCIYRSHGTFVSSWHTYEWAMSHIHRVSTKIYST